MSATDTKHFGTPLDNPKRVDKKIKRLLRVYCMVMNPTSARWRKMKKKGIKPARIISSVNALRWVLGQPPISTSEISELLENWREKKK